MPVILCWGYQPGPSGGAFAGLGRRWGCTAPDSPWRVIIMIGAGTLVWDGSPSWRGVPGGGVAQRRYAYAPAVTLPPSQYNGTYSTPLTRTSRLDPHAPTHRNNPICKNPPFSRTAVGLYGGGDGDVDSPTLFISVSFCLGTG